jgi:hypothetical protein
MASLIPTPWLLTAGGGVLLAATAAFGGLEEVQPPPVPTVLAGDQYTGSDLRLTVQGAELRTEGRMLGVYPDEGERILAVIVEAVNTFDEPRPATSLSSVSPVVDGIRVDGIDIKPAVSRADGSGGMMLQPDVPARLVLAWVVGPDDLHDGDGVTLTLPDSTHRVGANVQRGVDIWDDVVVGATLTTTVREIPASDEEGTP